MADERVAVPKTPPEAPPRRADDEDRRDDEPEGKPDDDKGDASDNSRRRADRTRLDDPGHHGRHRRKSRSRDRRSRRDETPRRQDREETPPDPKTGYVTCGVCNMQVGGGWYMGTNPIARPASTTKPALSTCKGFLGRKRKLARRKTGPSGTLAPRRQEPLHGNHRCCASGGPGHNNEETEGDPKHTFLDNRRNRPNRHAFVLLLPQADKRLCPFAPYKCAFANVPLKFGISPIFLICTSPLNQETK